MRVLVAFEFSGVVRDAFRAIGHDAWSCDLLPSESEFHLQNDARLFLDADWDLIIAHPPCTYIALCGNKHYAGTESRREAADFIWQIWNAPVAKLCIENPMGQINTYLPDMPKPQYVHPWEHGHREMKITGLWKRGLPDLVETDNVGPPPPKGTVERKSWERVFRMPPSKDRGKLRSITYAGIAKAMAEQWGGNHVG